MARISPRIVIQFRLAASTPTNRHALGFMNCRQLFAPTGTGFTYECLSTPILSICKCWFQTVLHTPVCLAKSLRQVLSLIVMLGLHLTFHMLMTLIQVNVQSPPYDRLPARTHQRLLDMPGLRLALHPQRRSNSIRQTAPPQLPKVQRQPTPATQRPWDRTQETHGGIRHQSNPRLQVQ